MNAVDTNVFVYALDADEPDKQSKAMDLIDRLSAMSVGNRVALRSVPCFVEVT